MIRECKKHGETEFKVHGKKKPIYRCLKCLSEKVDKRRHKLKELALEYKGNCCSICGYNKCKRALVFHHLDNYKKEFGIGQSGLTHSWEKLKKELDKCILVCANCHAEIHDKINSSVA